MVAILILAMQAVPALEWESSPEAAAEKAKQEGKLVLLLHLSGEWGNDDRT